MKVVRQEDFSDVAVDKRRLSNQNTVVAVITEDISDASIRNDLETVIRRRLDNEERSVALGLGFSKDD